MATHCYTALTAVLSLISLQAVTSPAYASEQSTFTKAVELIKNGTFEEGAENWVKDATIINAWKQKKPFEGRQFAWMGGNGKKASEAMSQVVAIPEKAEKAMLGMQLYIDTSEKNKEILDTFKVQITNENDELLKELGSYSNLDANDKYEERQFDLSEFKGKTIKLTFHCEENESNQTSFVFDNVSLTATLEGAEDPTPAPPTPSGEVKTFYTTSVKDNLDASDKVDFAKGMKGLGYDEMGTNANVSFSQLQTLIGRKDIGMLYHTGHGQNGLILTSGGTLSVNQISAVNVQHFIIATCLTLTPTSWKNKFGENCQSICGYTKTSLDIIDNKQVKSFVAHFKESHSVPKAFYLSNAAISQLSDRWCVYARTASGIVEYSARTNAHPSRNAVWMPIASNRDAHQLSLDSSLHDLRLDSAFAYGVSYQLSQDSRQGATDQAFLSGLEGDARVMGTGSDESVDREAASVFMAGRHDSNDYTLDKVIPVQMALDGQSTVCGHIVRYVKAVGQLPVRANGEDMHTVIFVKGGQVTGFREHWSRHETQNGLMAAALLTPQEALAKAAQTVLRYAKKDVHIVGIKPCLGLRGQQLVAAYELMDAYGTTFILDAATGNWL